METETRRSAIPSRVSTFPSVHLPAFFHSPPTRNLSERHLLHRSQRKHLESNFSVHRVTNRIHPGRLGAFLAPDRCLGTHRWTTPGRVGERSESITMSRYRSRVPSQFPRFDGEVEVWSKRKRKSVCGHTVSIQSGNRMPRNCLGLSKAQRRFPRSSMSSSDSS